MKEWVLGHQNLVLLLTAAAVVLLYIVVRIQLAWKKSRRKHVSELIAKTANGSIVIRESAAVQIVRQVLSDYPCIGSSQVAFSLEHDQYRIGIHCEFAMNATRSLSDLVPELEQRLKQAFRDKFGIDRICGVRLTISKMFAGN